MTSIKDYYRYLLSQFEHHKREIARQRAQIKLIEKADLAFTLSQARLAYFDGQAITGIGTGHQRKPDYLGYSPTDLALGEWKSTFEPPTTSSWRTVRESDPAEFTQTREQVAGWEQSGLSKDIGGHIIIIEGQLADYSRQIGRSYELPWARSHIKLAYTVSLKQKDNVVAAFNEIESRLQKRYTFESYLGGVTVTFVFEESAENLNLTGPEGLAAD